MIELMDTLIHSTISMKTVYVKSSKYINFGAKSNEKHRKFKVDDHVRTSNYFRRSFCNSKIKRKNSSVDKCY